MASFGYVFYVVANRHVYVVTVVFFLALVSFPQLSDLEPQ